MSEEAGIEELWQQAIDLIRWLRSFPNAGPIRRRQMMNALLFVLEQEERAYARLARIR